MELNAFTPYLSKKQSSYQKSPDPFDAKSVVIRVRYPKQILLSQSAEIQKRIFGLDKRQKCAAGFVPFRWELMIARSCIIERLTVCQKSVLEKKSAGVSSFPTRLPERIMEADFPVSLLFQFQHDYVKTFPCSLCCSFVKDLVKIYMLYPEI